MLRLIVIPLAFCLLLAAGEWTRFRGPNGSGISADTGFPISFSKDKNLIWRTPVREGKSSPVLTRTRIFLTAYQNEKLYIMAFDRITGKLLWERSVPRNHKQDIQQLNHPAAASPVTDGERVYVFFKDFGLLAYDSSGRELWRVALGPFTNTQGLAASPILVDDNVILQIDQLEGSYIAAYSKRNGELRWKSSRVESESWATPFLYQPNAGALQIITAGAGALGGHRASDGNRTFIYAEACPAMVSSPVMMGDTIYAFGYGAPPNGLPWPEFVKRYDKNGDGKLTAEEYGTDAMLNSIAKYMGNRDGIIDEQKWTAWAKHVGGYTGLLAIKLEGPSLTPRKLWSYDRGYTGVIPSPLVHEGIVYTVKNGGIFSAFDAQTGKELKTARLPDALGGYSASLVLAEGRIYASSEEGKISVIKSGANWEVIQTNDIGDGFFATPALVEGRIYARAHDTLYCFGSTAP
jgi:outer membrane protein assembly factor BamB